MSNSIIWLKKAVEFLDNGGDGTCDYCNGIKDQSSSDNPDKAIISLKNLRETSYAQYISVQNELVGAYTELRNRYAEKEYGMSYTQMLKDQKNSQSNETLNERIKLIKGKYPQIISEAEPTK